MFLASQSPRRLELLRQAGIDAEVYPSLVNEALVDEALPAEQRVCQLANLKAAAVARQIGNGYVIAADTLVVAADEVMGKPRDLDDARRMLIQLSGDTHYVVTGVCIQRKPDVISLTGAARTRVKFASLTPKELELYLKYARVLDKAGAYGIQELAGLFVENIEGSYTNVVGLPLSLVRSLLVRIHVESYAG